MLTSIEDLPSHLNARNHRRRPPQINTFTVSCNAYDLITYRVTHDRIIMSSNPYAVNSKDITFTADAWLEVDQADNFRFAVSQAVYNRLDKFSTITEGHIPAGKGPLKWKGIYASTKVEAKYPFTVKGKLDPECGETKEEMITSLQSMKKHLVITGRQADYSVWSDNDCKRYYGWRLIITSISEPTVVVKRKAPTPTPEDEPGPDDVKVAPPIKKAAVVPKKKVVINPVVEEEPKPAAKPKGIIRKPSPVIVTDDDESEPEQKAPPKPRKPTKAALAKAAALLASASAADMSE